MIRIRCWRGIAYQRIARLTVQPAFRSTGSLTADTQRAQRFARLRAAPVLRVDNESYEACVRSPVTAVACVLDCASIPRLSPRRNIPESKLAQCGISLKTMIQDLKFALRQLIKSPGFTAVAVFTLAVAIGVNSAIFALINGAILKPVVPLKPEEVVNVFNARQGANKEYRQFSWNEYQAVKQGSEVFADVAAVQFALAGLGRDEGMRRSFAFFASENSSRCSARSRRSGGSSLRKNRARTRTLRS
jgi:hypothetical protein